MVRERVEAEVRGDVHLDPLPPRVLGVVSGVVKRHRAVPNLVPVALVPVRAPRGDDVLGLAPPDLLRLAQGRPAAPLDGGERVPARAHRARPAVVAYPARVAVHPREVVLPRGHVERVLGLGDEGLPDDVELADRARVRAAVAELDDAAVLAGLLAGAVVEEDGAFPHPRYGLLGGERVDVQDRLPRRRGGLEVVHRGSAPDALDVRLVLPEVVHERAAKAHGRDLVLVVVDGAEPRVHRIVLDDAGADDRGERARVLGLHPGHRALAAEVLQEDVLGGLVGRTGGGASVGRHDGARGRTDDPRARGGATARGEGEEASARGGERASEPKRRGGGGARDRGRGARGSERASTTRAPRVGAARREARVFREVRTRAGGAAGFGFGESLGSRTLRFPRRALQSAARYPVAGVAGVSKVG